jgi:hypothetical protein
MAILVLIGLLLTPAIAGCAVFRAVQPSNAVLVRVEAKGGECPQGDCANRWEIRRDGRVIGTGQPVADIAPAALARLVAAVDLTDWTAVLARPFTGECPKNFDGLEYTYTFPTASGDVVVASCATQIDPGQEPFESIGSALFAVGG